MQAFTSAVFTNKHIEHLFHGIAFGNNNGFDLIGYAYAHNFTTFILDLIKHRIDYLKMNNYPFRRFLSGFLIFFCCFSLL